MRWRKLLLVLLWTPGVFLTLLTSVLFLSHYSKVKSGNELAARYARELVVKNGYQFYAALPEVLGSFSAAVEKGDARPEILRQFLRLHESPLEPFAEKIVLNSDAQGIDYRMIAAIGMCESNLGKKIPAGSYNAWGYAIYSGQSSGAEFGDWDHAIEVITNYLAIRFYSKGLTTPEQIGPIYAPPSVEKGNSWAKCVRRFMDELI
ncbi:MAG: hypothetical protein AAB874_08030 [Patescibacteria group bacterium]